MKIAIVAPSPVPFTIGGMEYLIAGLWESINKYTPHQAEIIKVPIDESSFWGIIDGYKKFYHMDLDHFDMVITTKYPAWMVRHPNHICYMAHRLRGVYDTYHLTGLPEEVPGHNLYINKVLKYMDQKGSTVEGLFDALDELYKVQEKVPEEFFALPGPFLRRVVRFMDDKALSHRRIRKFYAISENVKNRTEYFPEGAEVTVVYPPSSLPDFRQGSYDYLFTISRLDGPKRIALIIEAMKYVDADIKLKIAGTGPMEQELKRMAAGDSRIEFLGFVSDEEVVEYYSNARCVLFIPYDEDYGLVTIEAMMSGKPVITCRDSGGPKEFVEDGVTGFLSEPDPKDLARQIQRICDMPEQQIRQMGERALKKVSSINWKTVALELTGGDNQGAGKAVDRGSQEKQEERQGVRRSRGGSRKKLALACTFPVYPPRGGGQARIYHLFKGLTELYDIEIVSFTNHGERAFEGEIAPHVWETRISTSLAHHQLEAKMQKRVGCVVTDMAMPLLSKYTPEYGRALKRAMADADLVVVSHPYLYHEVKKYLGDRPLIYEAQDVEYDIKKGILPDSPEGREFLNLVRATEEECCKAASLIVVCSQEDAERLSQLYDVPTGRMVVVPNGVDTQSIPYTDIKSRRANKKEMDLENQKIALFMGSWHPPNLEACRIIFDFARQTPDIHYLLMGSQCHAFIREYIPPNVGLMGIVSDEEKEKIFALADIALNPVISGSGTNLKMFDYMAAGLPVLTTPFGARGIDDTSHMWLADIEQMPEMIKNILEMGDKIEEKTQSARRYVEDRYDWSKLSRILLERLLKYNLE